MSDNTGFSEQERAAIKQRAAELKGKAAAGERDVLAKIAEMAAPDHELAERLHALILSAAPELAAKLWYGQPAYAKAGKVVCFFRSGQVDKERYSTLGFTVEANLDEDEGLWPTAYALTRWSDTVEAKIKDLVTRAVSKDQV